MRQKTGLTLLQIDDTRQDRHKYCVLCWPRLSTTPTVDHVLSAHAHNLQLTMCFLFIIILLNNAHNLTSHNTTKVWFIHRYSSQWNVNIRYNGCGARGVCALESSSLLLQLVLCDLFPFLSSWKVWSVLSGTFFAGEFSTNCAFVEIGAFQLETM